MSHLRKAGTIAHYTLVSAYRSRTLWLAVISVMLCWLAADFAAALALTESSQMRFSVYAFLARLAAVLIVSLLVVNSIQHEFADRQLNLFVSLDLPRAAYIIGKLAGFIGAAVIIALLVLIPLLLVAEWRAALLWTGSLFLELSIVVAFSLFVITAIHNNTLAFSAILALYVVCRIIADILLLSQSPILEGGGSGQVFIGWLLQVIYVVLPDLWNYARTEWLLYGHADWSVLGGNLLQALIAVPLLALATVFDFYRRNL